MTLFTDAVREQIQLRAAIDGPTGGGKTFTSLQWARILAGPEGLVALIDTENRSSLRYAPAPGEEPERLNYWDPPYRFKRRDAEAPYNPVKLGELIQASGAFLGPDGVLIVDSLTHFWTGEGGTLDVVDQAKIRNSGAMSGWQEGTPVQRYLLEQILRCPCHIIVTMRSKMSYEIQQSVDEKGAKRTTIERMGMAPEQRPGIEYEFDIVASMDVENRLTVTKSRIPGLMGLVMHKGRSHEIALGLSEWLATGARHISAQVAAAIRVGLDSIQDEEKRRAIKQQFKDRFGIPEMVLEAREDEAVDWVIKAAGIKPDTPAKKTAAKRSPAKKTAAKKAAGARKRVESGPGHAEPITPMAEALTEAIEQKGESDETEASEAPEA